MKKLILSGVLFCSFSLANAQSETDLKISEAPVYAVNFDTTSGTTSNSVSASQQSSNQQNDNDQKKKKSFSKSFSLTSTDKINLHNQYGGMMIKSGTKRK